MLRHLIIAAWRNMAANKLLSAISILGLSVGIAAALLMALVVRNQTTFDNFIPGHERTYLAMSPPDRIMPGALLDSDPSLATALWLRSPEIEAVTRLADPLLPGRKSFQLGAGNVIGWDSFYWADPNAFDVLRLPVLDGQMANALSRPDSVVMTESLARKYFGRADAVGQVLMISGHPMTVQAVLRDLPVNGTSLKSGIFASDLAPFAKVANDIRDQGVNVATVYTYVRLRPSGSVTAVERSADAYLAGIAILKGTPYASSHLIRLDHINLLEQFNPGINARLTAETVASLLVLLVAIANFVSLSLARSLKRQKEVGIRKSCGADRAALILQFLGEATIAVAIAGALAVAGSEWLLPPLNAFLGTGAILSHGYDASLLPLLVLGTALVILAVGGWPALVLSAIRPAWVIRGSERRSTGLVPNIMVTLQFAVLIVLAVAATVVLQQRDFAAQAAPRAEADQMLIVKIQNGDPCHGALRNELRRLPGVVGEGCSTAGFLTGQVHFIGGSPDFGPRYNFTIGFGWANPGLLALYGIRPVAGTFGPLTAEGDVAANFGVIINESAVRKLGFASPTAAIGQSWLRGVPDRPRTHRWIGAGSLIKAVVPDFAFYSVAQPREATLFTPLAQLSNGGGLIHLKLDGRHIPDTLAAIDRVWKETNQDGPVNRFFLSEYMQQQYLGITREGTLFAIFAAIAIILACLGLFSIAIAAAERRTNEIGVRKAMGADDRQVVLLLLWQFAQPVLWANVVAWPAAWWLMRQWLAGFAYHVELQWWVFAAASLSALLIALLTVAGQAFLTARQKPVLALRYE